MAIPTLDDMDGLTRYVNTDLDLFSVEDLGPLAAFFEAQGILFTMDQYHLEDGSWSAHFEASREFAEPEACISEILRAIEALSEPISRLWWSCNSRNLNIGYNCGLEPQNFTNALSNETLKRMGAVGATLVLTLYRAGLPETEA